MNTYTVRIEERNVIVQTEATVSQTDMDNATTMLAQGKTDVEVAASLGGTPLVPPDPVPQVPSAVLPLPTLCDLYVAAGQEVPPALAAQLQNWKDSQAQTTPSTQAPVS